MTTDQARAILLRVDHGEAVPVTDYVTALLVCHRSGFPTVAAFLSA